MISSERIAHHLTLPVSLILATSRPGGGPDLVRCGVARLGDDGLLRVAVPLPEGARTLTSIEANGLVALSAVRPTSYHTLQIKGRDARRIDWPEHAALAAAHRELFIAETLTMSVAREVPWRMLSHRYEAVAFTPCEVYDQTPGAR